MNYNNMDDEYFGSCVSSTVLKVDHIHQGIKSLRLIFFFIKLSYCFRTGVLNCFCAMDSFESLVKSKDSLLEQCI
jgi:hypothetical protein